MKRRDWAAVAARARRDQLDAQTRHAGDAAELSRLGRETAAKARELQAEMDAFPAALDAAMEALSASGVDLCGRVMRIRQLTAETDERARAAHALAELLGEPVGPVKVPDPLEEIRGGYPDSDLHRRRVFDASLRTPADVVHELGAAVSTQLHADAQARPFGDLTIG